MAEVRWSLRARRDLRNIEEFISNDSAIAATRLIGRLFAAAERLEQFPRSGRVVPEFQTDELRELIVGSYRLVYYQTEGRVLILRAVHGARDVRQLLSDLPEASN